MNDHVEHICSATLNGVALIWRLLGPHKRASEAPRGQDTTRIDVIPVPGSAYAVWVWQS